MNDGVHIKGMVRQLDEEQMDYRRILGDDDILHIIEQSRHDKFRWGLVLVLSLGSFLPRTEIKISITYAIDLFDSKEPIIQFQFPSYLGRYKPKSTTPTVSRDHGSVENNCPTAISINMDIEMPGEILYVYSNLPFQDIPVPSPKGFKCTSRKQFTSSKALPDTDFLVSIQALGLDQSRCFVEEFQDTAALSLNIVPYTESGQDRDNCEYIFLIDRSWSMCMDDKMEQTKQAMKILLKTLPILGTWPSFMLLLAQQSVNSCPDCSQLRQNFFPLALAFFSLADMAFSFCRDGSVAFHDRTSL
ncbi:hypothetical protein Clacol_004601 [Clathrus columnatus]|uniref:Uncharacterized protein n=1 Tax=Clathrus columnatus TaxID=1419009 RepID=A0AAV5AEJ6_9AGAM|nr:hypothetical protein Clacol_004601 [Clathrus columnatus]